MSSPPPRQLLHSGIFNFPPLFSPLQSWWWIEFCAVRGFSEIRGLHPSAREGSGGDKVPGESGPGQGLGLATPALGTSSSPVLPETSSGVLEIRILLCLSRSNSYAGVQASFNAWPGPVLFFPLLFFIEPDRRCQNKPFISCPERCLPCRQSLACCGRWGASHGSSAPESGVLGSAVLKCK